MSGSQRAADPLEGGRWGLRGHGGDMVAWWCFEAGEGKSDRTELPVLAFPQARLPQVHQESTREAVAFLIHLIPPCALKQGLFPHGAAVIVWFNSSLLLIKTQNSSEIAFQGTRPKRGLGTFAAEQPKLLKMFGVECSNSSTWELAVPHGGALNSALLRTEQP